VLDRAAQCPAHLLGALTGDGAACLPRIRPRRARWGSFRDRANSNFSSNIVSESGSTDFVEDLVGLQTEAAGDDLFLDVGGAAEDRLAAKVSRQSGIWRRAVLVRT
jgi:hypothetical protein